MRIKYFKKEYYSEYSDGTYGIGFLDTEQTYNNEGQDYLAQMYFIELDKYMLKISIGDDFIDMEELDNLHEIPYEEYQMWVQFYNQVYETASAMIHARNKKK